MLPPPAQEDLDKKQPRPRPNQDVRANDAKAEENDTPDDTTKKHRNDADYEDPPAAGVEENISVSPRSLLPPSTPEDTTKKHDRERPSKGIQANDAKADENDGGSRLIPTDSMTMSDRGNNRTCLLDSIMQILPPTTNRHLVQSAITSSMPKEGDTSVKNIKQALADSGLILVRVGGKYIRKGGRRFTY
jgi:hypothetical protein